MRVLLTGGSGFIGQHLARQLGARHEVLVSTRFRGVGVLKMRVVDYLTDALCRAGGEGLKALAEHTR